MKEEEIKEIKKAQNEKTMLYLWEKVQDDYKGCTIEYFLKDQAKIMGIDLPKPKIN